MPMLFDLYEIDFVELCLVPVNKNLTREECHVFNEESDSFLVAIPSARSISSTRDLCLLVPMSFSFPEPEPVSEEAR